MKKKLLALLLVFVFVIGGCVGGKPVTPGPIELVDDFGREVQLETAAASIVSLAPSSTEIIFALGCGDLLVGATEYCNYPEEAEEIPRVGGFSDPNLEEIVALEPDLVLAASLHQETVEALEDMEIAVLALNPEDIEGIYANINLIAKAIGAEESAADLIASMKKRLKSVADTISALGDEERPVVYYEVWYPAPMTAGEDTFIHEMITLAGGKNVAWGTTGWPTLQEEELFERNPQVIVHGYYDVETSVFAARDGWNVITAVAEENIYFIDPDIINRTGPRVVDAVEQMVKFFHPYKF